MHTSSINRRHDSGGYISGGFPTLSSGGAYFASHTETLRSVLTSADKGGRGIGGHDIYLLPASDRIQHGLCLRQSLLLLALQTPPIAFGAAAHIWNELPERLLDPRNGVPARIKAGIRGLYSGQGGFFVSESYTVRTGLVCLDGLHGRQAGGGGGGGGVHESS